MTVTIFDVIMALCLGVAFLIGRKKGFAFQAAGFASLFGGHYAARKFAPMVRTKLEITSPFASVISWGIVYFAVAAAIFLLAAWIRKQLKEKDLEELDSHLGGVLAAGQAGVVLSILILLTITLSPRAQKSLEGTITGKVIYRAAGLVKDYLPRETAIALGYQDPGEEPIQPNEQSWLNERQEQQLKGITKKIRKEVREQVKDVVEKELREGLENKPIAPIREKVKQKVKEVAKDQLPPPAAFPSEPEDAGDHEGQLDIDNAPLKEDPFDFTPVKPVPTDDH